MDLDIKKDLTSNWFKFWLLSLGKNYNDNDNDNDDDNDNDNIVNNHGVVPILLRCLNPEPSERLLLVF